MRNEETRGQTVSIMALRDWGRMADVERMLDEKGGGLGASGHAQLLQHVAEVVLDGLVTQPQDQCNFLVGLALGDQAAALEGRDSARDPWRHGSLGFWPVPTHVG